MEFTQGWKKFSISALNCKPRTIVSDPIPSNSDFAFKDFAAYFQVFQRPRQVQMDIFVFLLEFPLDSLEGPHELPHVFSLCTVTADLVACRAGVEFFEVFLSHQIPKPVFGMLGRYKLIRICLLHMVSQIAL
jgi:hypothetical protein